MKVGICQTDILFEDKEFNLKSAKDYIADSAANNAKFVVFPEMSMTGFTMSPEKVYETDGGLTETAMAEYAISNNIAIGFGLVKKRNDGYYNCYEIMNNSGQIICEYDKLHPFSFSKEDEYYKKGDKVCTCQIDGVTIAPFICYDLRFPEPFLAASREAELLIVAANWGGARDEHWKLLLKARALENQAYVIGVNRVGNDPITFYKGSSMWVNPEGVAEGELESTSGIMYAEIDKERVKNFREYLPIKKDRRAELYSKL